MDDKKKFDRIHSGASVSDQDILSTLEMGSGFQDKEKARTIIKVMGVGGGGNNAINHMYMQNIEGVSFVVLNTDKQQLNESPVPNRVLLGPNTTHGLGVMYPKSHVGQPRRARPRLPNSLTTTPRWSSSLPVWVVAPVRVLRLSWRASLSKRACSPSVS